MKFAAAFILILLAKISFGETKGFYCTASVWRVYSVLPKATPNVEPIPGTHRVIEQAKGIHATFKKDGEFLEYLELKDGYAIAIRGILAPNGSTNFVIKLVSREGKAITKILGEHKETFYIAQNKVDRVPLSVDVSNIQISNAYLNLRTTTLDDKNYDKLASSIMKGHLADGSITEASVECSPEF